MSYCLYSWVWYFLLASQRFFNITTFCFYFFVISPRLCNNCLSLQFTLTSEILTRSRVSLSPRSPHQVINCSGCRADGAGLKHNVKYLCTFHRKRFVSRVIKCQDALTRPTGYFFAMSKCIFYLIIFKNVISSKSKWSKSQSQSLPLNLKQLPSIQR